MLDSALFGGLLESLVGTLSGPIAVLMPIFGLIGFGAITAKQNWLGDNATHVLNRFVVRLALPAELFHITAQMPLQQLDHPAFAAVSGLGMALTFTFAWSLRWWQGKGAARGVEGEVESGAGNDSALPQAHPHRLSHAAIDGLSASYANTSFIGIPVCLAVFGTQSMAAIGISTLLTVCALFGVALFMIEIDEHAGAGRVSSIVRVARALALNPLVFAPLIGIALNFVKAPIPAAGLTIVNLLAGAATPCALLVIGMFLAQSDRNAHAPISVVARLIGLKILVHPALTLVLATKVFAMHTVWVQEALLLSALPTGTGPFMLARLYRRDAVIASKVTLLTTIISIVTIAAIVAWIGHSPVHPPQHVVQAS